MIDGFLGFIVGQEWIFLIIIGIIVVAIILTVIKMMKKKTKEVVIEKEEPVDEIKNQNEKAMKILKQRLAKGEISKEEYEKLKNEFKNN